MRNAMTPARSARTAGESLGDSMRATAQPGAIHEAIATAATTDRSPASPTYSIAAGTRPLPRGYDASIRLMIPRKAKRRTPRINANANRPTVVLSEPEGLVNQTVIPFDIHLPTFERMRLVQCKRLSGMV